MTASQALISQTTPVFSQVKIDIPFAQQLGSTQDEKQEIRWDSKYSLQSAKLTIDATQTYDSGADLEIIVNGLPHASTTDQIHWEAFETQDKFVTLDITSELLNGLNTFKAVYHTAEGLITAQECVVNATLAMLFIGPATSGQPASYSSPGGPSSWQDFLKNSAFWLKVLAIFGFISVGALLVWKLSPGAWVKSLFNRIPR